MFRCDANGNCLYNACSIALVGTSNMSQILRALASAELYLNASFYKQHPYFTELAKTHKSFAKGHSHLYHSLTKPIGDTLEEDVTKVEECLRLAALQNCVNKEWSPFVFLLALSNVIGIPIYSFYPKGIYKFGSPIVCNAHIFPRDSAPVLTDPIRLLWMTDSCYATSKPLNANHFVPFFYIKSLSQTNDQNQSVGAKGAKGKGLVQSRLVFKLTAGSDKEDDNVTEDNQVRNSGVEIKVASPSTRVMVKQERCDTKIEDELVELDEFEGQRYDIGRYAKSAKIADDVKYDALKNVWMPERNFKFPQRSFYEKNRCFQSAWLQNFQWLAYSAIHDGAFCVPCVLFGRKIGSKIDQLISSPLTDWSSANRRFKAHQMNSGSHKTALVTMQEFTRVMERKIKPINEVQECAYSKKVTKNREKLAPIVKTILLCARQNIPLRGHPDDSNQYETNNCGNFQALLDFRVDSGDKVLQNHFETAPRNATYRPKTIQNELITCAAEVVNNRIIDEIKSSKFYSIMADEVADCSNREQMPLVIRYLDPQNEIQERFVKFISCDKGTSGEALKDKIIECPRMDLQLDLKDCRGQCYDGAGNMAGKYRGVAARILALNDLALYTHCASHKLNLCVAASCKLQNVRNMMDNIQIIAKFFDKSPKRQLLLEKMVQQYLPTYNHNKLIDICRTRWVLRVDGLARFADMYIAIAEALFCIRDNADGEWDNSASDAYGLATVSTNFDFIMSLVIVRMCLGYTRYATVQLQGAHIDILKGLKEVEIMTKSLQTARDSIDIYHSEWYKKACDIANKVDAAVKCPRIGGKQQHRANAPSDNVFNHYKVNVAIPFLDHFLEDIKRSVVFIAVCVMVANRSVFSKWPSSST